MHAPEPLHANIKANRPALTVCAGRQHRAVGHAYWPRCLQIKQTGPFVDAAFWQGPGLLVKDTCKSPVVGAGKYVPLVRQRIELLQLTIIWSKIHILIRPTGPAPQYLTRQVFRMGRAVPALTKVAHGHGLAHLLKHESKHILQYQHIIVHQKKPAASAVFKRILIADAVTVGCLVQAGGVCGIEIKPVVGLKHPATVADFAAQVLRNGVGTDNIILRAVGFKLQPHIAHMLAAVLEQRKHREGCLIRLGENIHRHVDGIRPALLCRILNHWFRHARRYCYLAGAESAAVSAGLSCAA